GRSTWKGGVAARRKQWPRPELASKLACLRGDRCVTQLETLIEAILKYQPGADLAVLERASRFLGERTRGRSARPAGPYSPIRPRWPTSSSTSRWTSRR